MKDLTFGSETDLDVVIIGAGISGLNTAFRLKSLRPRDKFVVLENRGDLGGTWDLFNYPGIRSDSDFYSFGFAWSPWQGGTTLAEKHKILAYFKKACEDNGLNEYIRYHQQVISAKWSSKELRWTLDVSVNGSEKLTQYKARWVLFGTGYYDHAEPRKAIIPGIENFKGELIHTQFWPKEANWDGKSVAVIGSGATAVSLIPALAKTAKVVTMVQRSPTYILSVDNKDGASTRFMRRVLPEPISRRLIRWRWITTAYMFFFFCAWFPEKIKAALRKSITPLLPEGYNIDKHFKPKYNVGEQRVCFVPDGGFYKNICNGKINVVTGIIKTVTEDGLIMEDGEKVKVDMLVTATGLKVRFGGGINVTVDGEKFQMGGTLLWRGGMFHGLPNAANVYGYNNASFTLGADTTAHRIVRLMNIMDSQGSRVATPRLPKNFDPADSECANHLKSTFVRDAFDTNNFPLVAKSAGSQWARRTNYFTDMINAKYGDITSGIEFSR